jgi:hypothetical protein
MDSVGSLLPKVLRRRGLYEHAAASLVTLKAQEWLTAELPMFAGAITVPRFSQGVLEIACANSIASQECHSLVPVLLAHLTRECEGMSVKEVRVVRVARK